MHDERGGQVGDAPRPPHRLTRLRPPERAAAAMVAVLLALPFALAVQRAVSGGFEPSGDVALLALRSLDVPGRHSPLVGQPTTSHLYGAIATDHPGPVQPWLFSPLVHALGGVGMVVGAALVNAAAVLVGAWVAFRRGGPAVGLVAAVVLATVTWSQGTVVLADPLSSNQGAFALVATALVMWGVACGDHRLLPLGVGVASFAAQQHLAYLGPALGLVGWGLAVWLGAGPSVDGQHRLDRLRGSARWLVAAAALGLVLWLPPLLEVVREPFGNPERVVRFAVGDDRPSIGLGRGVDAALRVAGTGLVPVGDLTGDDVVAQLSTWGRAAGALVLVLLVLAALPIGSRSGRDRRLLAVAALVLFGVGALNAGNVVAGVEATRINLYRWVFAAWAVGAIALAWAAGSALARARSRLPGPAASVSAGSLRRAGFAVAVVALGGLAVVGSGERQVDDLDPRRAAWPMIAALAEEAAVIAADGGQVTLVLDGDLAEQEIGPGLAFALERQGIDVRVVGDPGLVGRFFGSQRDVPGSPPPPVLLVRTDDEAPRPGTLVARVTANPDLAALVERLAPRFADGVVVRPGGFERILSRGFGPPAVVSTSFAASRLEREPTEVLRSDALLVGVALGALERPSLTSAERGELLRLWEEGGALGLLGEGEAELRLISPAEADAHGP